MTFSNNDITNYNLNYHTSYDLKYWNDRRHSHEVHYGTYLVNTLA